MTKTSFLPHPIPAAAMLLVSLGVAVAASPAAEVVELPMTCAVELNDKGRMVEITARLATDEHITGTYALSISSPSSRIRQGGPFDLEAGDDVTLGKTMMSGNPDQFDIDLTLDWDGRELTCPSIEL
ncbi:MAG: hypothetical protein GY945_15535 [Rhodobacteraceae bacterium]|nr:hypothetical protein [Paracoccaceae bacterium]